MRKQIYIIRDKLASDFPVFAVERVEQAQRIFRTTLASVPPSEHDDFTLIYVGDVDEQGNFYGKEVP